MQKADVAAARAIAFVDADDQSNIHAAMRAARRSPGIRIVIRMYNQRLGDHIQQLIDNSTVLSASATAAPAFANSALRRPSAVQAGGRNLRLAIGPAIDMGLALCVVANDIDPSDPASIGMLPRTAGPAMEWIEHDVLRLQSTESRQRAVLQFLDSEAGVEVSRRSRFLWALIDALRFFTSAKVRLTLIIALTMAALSFAGIWYLSRPFGWAVYESLLDVAGSAVPDTYGQPSAVGGVWQRVFQVAITFSGILLIPVVTAIFLESTASRRGARARLPSAGIRGHVVVVGLGNAGTRVATLFHELGVPVVGIERDPGARGIVAVRGLDIPVLVGDGPIDEMLRQAHVTRARAVVALTGDDVANLEAALEARAIQPDVRVVVRLFDDDFADHIYKEFGNTASRSVSYLAAPAFAAAMMGREVLGTLSVYRHVLLIAEITVTENSDLVGLPLRDVDRAGLTRVLALRRERDTAYAWRPADHGRRLDVGDSLIVAATRAGLGSVHGQDH
jgi:Trk K+ transport system NAD-binding subunit